MFYCEQARGVSTTVRENLEKSQQYGFHTFIHALKPWVGEADLSIIQSRHEMQMIQMTYQYQPVQKKDHSDLAIL